MSKKAFQQEILDVKQELIDQHRALGMEASGKWIENLETYVEVTLTNFVAEFFGLDYTEQLNKGREPGTWPDVESIRDWIIDKPVTPQDNITIDQLAYLISRKIFRYGTEYYVQGGTDLLESVFTEERVRKIALAIGELKVKEFSVEINYQLRNISEIR